MGAYDPVKAVFNRLGTAEFHKVAMQPGMPQGFGSIGTPGIPVITLPGNPVSAYVSFEVFARPALRKLSGRDPQSDRAVQATLTEPMKSPESKVQFARGRFVVTPEGLAVEPVGSGQGSHFMGGLAQAECLIVIPVGTSHLDAGSLVEVIDIRERFER
jgi:molybdopterin molybdotransferase